MINLKCILFIASFWIVGCSIHTSISSLNLQESSISLKGATPPTLPEGLTDGTFYISLTQSPVLSWYAAVENGSQLAKYQLALGTTIGSIDALSWTDIGLVTSYQALGLNLVNGVTYYPTIRAIDTAGNISNVISGDGWVAVSAPSNITSIDDDSANASLTGSPTISWVYPGTLVSGPAGFRYEIAIGTTAGSSDILTWTSASTATSFAAVGLSLILGNRYFASVRIKDNSGTIYSTKQGDGWYVVQAVTSAARYANALNWNTYVLRSNGTSSCTGTTYFDCIHGGEARKVTYATAGSCTNYTITDELNAFDWACDATGGAGNVFFYSRGLKFSKGLADLVNSTSWKNNRVVISLSGVPVAASSRSAWWTNSVLGLPDTSSPQTLAANTIYTVSTNSTVLFGFAVSAGTAVVTMPGATVNAGPGDLSLITAIGNFYWLEGNFKGASDFGNLLSGSNYQYAVVRRLNASNFNVALGDQGMTNGTQKSWYSQLHLAYNSFAGIVQKSGRNIFSDIVLSNNGIGFYHGDITNDNILRNILAINNSGEGLGGYNSYRNLMQAVTLLNNGTGYNMWNNTDNVIHNMVSLNSGVSLDPHNDTKLTVSQVVLESINLLLNTTLKFTNNLLLVGGFPSCIVSGGTNPGLVNGTCANQGSSNALHISLTSLGVATFKGSLIATDSSNQSNLLGAAAFSSITDFTHFSNLFRAWMPDFTFPSTSTQGPCSSGNCRIFDASLKSSDTLLRNTTGDGSSQNGAFVNGAACPSSIGGNVNTTTIATAPKTFLTNAMEIFGEGGNNNGLCESNESCLYMPNFGAYQGSGDFWNNSCTFSNGTITGVKMYGFPIN